MVVALHFRPAILDRDIAAFGPAALDEPLRESGNPLTLALRRALAHELDDRRLRLLRAHAAATPPSATSNSRRPMVTVIRPSRARCVEGRIPPHERAVLTARHPARVDARSGTNCNGVPTGPRLRLDFKRFIFGRFTSSRTCGTMLTRA